MCSSPAATLLPDSPDYPKSCNEVVRLCPDDAMVGLL